MLEYRSNGQAPHNFWLRLRGTVSGAALSAAFRPRHMPVFSHFWLLPTANLSSTSSSTITTMNTSSCTALHSTALHCHEENKHPRVPVSCSSSPPSCATRLPVVRLLPSSWIPRNLPSKRVYRKSDRVNRMTSSRSNSPSAIGFLFLL